ncbi:hypothetical protein AYI69_g11203 [Smittium culicis]|uniref:Endonuclease/exonuclease/phosphatase domain-containing protein n=1 Tax=Smittium culicis TaxID=133412 RepID=A0A1R1X0C9_9FUNG|nr:hypothetical protein AYI69_g11203 [Smittium culicis]
MLQNTANPTLDAFERQKVSKKQSSSHDTLKVNTYNIRSIKNSKEELEHYLSSCKPDILVLQETFLNKKSYRCRLPGYTCIEAKADLTKGGIGLLIAVKNNIGLDLNEYKSAPT